MLSLSGFRLKISGSWFQGAGASLSRASSNSAGLKPFWDRSMGPPACRKLGSRRRRCEYRANDSLSLSLNLLQMFIAVKAFGVDLVDFLSAERARSEPPVLRNHLDTPDGVAISGRVGQDGQDLFARQIGNLNALFGDPFK